MHRIWSCSNMQNQIRYLHIKKKNIHERILVQFYSDNKKINLMEFWTYQTLEMAISLKNVSYYHLLSLCQLIYNLSVCNLRLNYCLSLIYIFKRLRLISLYIVCFRWVWSVCLRLFMPPSQRCPALWLHISSGITVDSKEMHN